MKIHEKEVKKAYERIFRDLEYIIRAVVQDEILEMKKEVERQDKIKYASVKVIGKTGKGMSANLYKYAKTNAIKVSKSNKRKRFASKKALRKYFG